MSLKAFHIFFIALSVLFAFAYAAWLFGDYRASGNPVELYGAFGSGLAGTALVWYAARFLRKLKHVKFL